MAIMSLGSILGMLLLCTMDFSQPLAHGDEEQLSAKIGQADREKFKQIIDAKDWGNPYLIVGRDGVTIVSNALPNGRKLVATHELQKTLIALDLVAWPYGRVVALQEIGIRSGDDDKLIHQNVKVVKELLEKLKVTIEPWPS